MKMDVKMRILAFLFLLIVLVSQSSAATHSLQYFYTAVTPGITFTEFTTVGLVDKEQFYYYDSNIRKAFPKVEWIKKVVGDDPEYWNIQTQVSQDFQEVFKADIATLMQRFNHTKGVHTVQLMYGCEMYDDRTKRGYMQYGYDGEDFLSLDLKTETWIAPVSQAVITKHKWDSVGDAKHSKSYLLNICIEWLQKYVGYGRSTLERKVSPEVSLFQSDSSSPVVCHATGFFPRAVMISWKKNGEDVREDVDLRETVPNQDGTFQKRSVLTVSPEDLEKHQYTCVVQHSSLKENLVLQVSNRRILKGVLEGESVGVIVGAVVAFFLLVIIACVGTLIWKQKKSEKKTYKDSDHSGSSAYDLLSQTTHSSGSISSSDSNPSGSSAYDLLSQKTHSSGSISSSDSDHSGSSTDDMHDMQQQTTHSCSSISSSGSDQSVSSDVCLLK